MNIAETSRPDVRRRGAVILALVLAVSAVCGTTAMTQESGRAYENAIVMQALRELQCRWFAHGIVEVEMARVCDNPGAFATRYPGLTIYPNAQVLGWDATQLRGMRVGLITRAKNNPPPAVAPPLGAIGAGSILYHGASVRFQSPAGRVIAQAGLTRNHCVFGSATMSDRFYLPNAATNPGFAMLMTPNLPLPPFGLGRYTNNGFLVEEF